MPQRYLTLHRDVVVDIYGVVWLRGASYDKSYMSLLKRAAIGTRFFRSFLLPLFQVIDYYQQKRVVVNLHAEKAPSDVTREIEKALS